MRLHFEQENLKALIKLVFFILLFSAALIVFLALKKKIKSYVDKIHARIISVLIIIHRDIAQVYKKLLYTSWVKWNLPIKNLVILERG